MIQNKNQQFLSSEPALVHYLNRLLQQTKSLDAKIKEQKQRTQQLLFNISTLFGLQTSRNKIQEQMIKQGMLIPVSQNNELDEIVKKINKKITTDVAQSSIKDNFSFKRNLDMSNDREGLVPGKKRHFQTENQNKHQNYERSKNQSSNSSINSFKSNNDKINQSSSN